MSTITKKSPLTPAALTASAATYYLCPANVRATIKKVTVANGDSAARTVTAYLVPSGGAAGATNIAVVSFTLAISETRDIFEIEGHNISAADFLQVKVDAITTTAPTIHVTVVETTV